MNNDDNNNYRDDNSSNNDNNNSNNYIYNHDATNATFNSDNRINFLM